MGTMKTPGVYIVEKSAFPNSVVEVATAVPAFIGYTQKADNKGRTLRNKAWRITSMAEFHNYYGFAPEPQFEISPKPKDPAVEAEFAQGGTEYILKQAGTNHLLYRCMRLFFQNGGGPCYIVSVGSYNDAIEADPLKKGIGQLIKEQEPTMVVIPETVLFAKDDDAINVQQAMIAHCGGKMKSRVAILDLWAGHKERQDTPDCIDGFRDKLGINYLDFAMAYYPWLNTTIVQDPELSFENISNKAELQTLLRAEAGGAGAGDGGLTAKQQQQQAAIDSLTSWDGAPKAAKSKDDKAKDEKATGGDNASTASGEDPDALKKLLDKSLIAMSPLYVNILAAIKNRLNLLPPAAAMAGIYTMVDNSRGVWKAPANVSLSAVVSPAVNISHDDQEDLNVTTQGKSINAIRSFIGEGTLVWGARTLDGNSLDWRYINVRRTMIMLEESIRLATKAYVFEPNDANTWVTIKSMVRNFLTGIWKRGGLAGAVPDDAFSVHVGLGDTMTSEDILEGILRVSVFVAVSRPAEFIEITFQQQMQKS